MKRQTVQEEATLIFMLVGTTEISLSYLNLYFYRLCMVYSMLSGSSSHPCHNLNRVHS